MSSPFVQEKKRLAMYKQACLHGFTNQPYGGDRKDVEAARRRQVLLEILNGSGQSPEVQMQQARDLDETWEWEDFAWIKQGDVYVMTSEWAKTMGPHTNLQKG